MPHRRLSRKQLQRLDGLPASVKVVGWNAYYHGPVVKGGWRGAEFVVTRDGGIEIPVVRRRAA